MIGDLHFLRPEWLLTLIAAAALAWIVSRREDARNRWRGIIAPHLLDHLVVGRRESRRWQPVHLTAALIAFGGIAAAGPTWERERPPFVEDTAPLAIAVDLSQTMDAVDVSPTRLERAKLKVHDLLTQRPGARTAIFAYAGSAHMVLPLTDDVNLIRTYVDSLATGLMPVPGRNTAKALQTIDAALAREDTPGTILFLTDGVEPVAFDAFRNHSGKNEIMVLGIGTTEGGAVKTGDGSFLADASGRRVLAKLDTDGLRQLKSEAHVQVATVALDDTDVDWIQRRIRTHLQHKQADGETRWKDLGWWLVVPGALLSSLWFRRGWTIRWVSTLWLGVALTAPSHAHAADWSLLNLWLTPDQQGRLAFERGDYTLAARRFADPLWTGVALYRAGRYDEAVTAFARIDTAESYYNQGNALARLGQLAAAAASYREALTRRPDWPEAKTNLALVQSLIAKAKKDDQTEEEPSEKPDEVTFDDRGKRGRRGEVDVARQTAEMWMRNIQTTPAGLLARKFAIEAQREAQR